MKWILLSIVVIATVLADLLQSHEMKIAASEKGSIGYMAVSFFAFLALVQSQPLSFAVPASAAAFVLETVLARLVLNEHVDARRAAGALFVLGGIVLLGKFF